MSSLAPSAGGPGMAVPAEARLAPPARMAPVTDAASAPRLAQGVPAMPLPRPAQGVPAMPVPRLAQGVFAMPAPRRRIGDPAPGATTLREDCLALGAWCLTLALAGTAAGWLVLS